DDLVVRANVGVADPALIANAADDVTLGRDDVTDVEPVRTLRIGPELDDLAQQLVPDDPHVASVAIERLVDHVPERTSEPDSAIGTAESGHDRPHEDVRAIMNRVLLVDPRPLDLGLSKADRGFPRVFRPVVGESPHAVAWHTPHSALLGGDAITSSWWES